MNFSYRWPISWIQIDVAATKIKYDHSVDGWHNLRKCIAPPPSTCYIVASSTHRPNVPIARNADWQVPCRVERHARAIIVVRLLSAFIGRQSPIKARCSRRRRRWVQICPSRKLPPLKGFCHQDLQDLSNKQQFSATLIALPSRHGRSCGFILNKS